jgi:hypothetical protein
MEAPCAESNPEVYCIEEAGCKRSPDLRVDMIPDAVDKAQERVIYQYLFNADSAAVQSFNQ